MAELVSGVRPFPLEALSSLEAIIYRIVGVDKITNRLVDVAIADNDAEKRMILREERRNYYDLRAIPLRMTYQASYAAQVGA